jgi:hypothetical protein
VLLFEHVELNIENGVILKASKKKEILQFPLKIQMHLFLSNLHDLNLEFYFYFRIDRQFLFNFIYFWLLINLLENENGH